MLPCSGVPALPERSAIFQDSATDPDAIYGPDNELLQLRLDLDDGKDRDHTRTYDVMGRLKESTVVSNEAGSNVTRTFLYGYDVPAGTYTRTGPDGNVTTVQMDAAERVQYVKRVIPGTPETVRDRQRCQGHLSWPDRLTRSHSACAARVIVA